MTIFVSLTSSGTAFIDINSMEVESSVSEYGVSSNFVCNLPNYGGRHKNDFTIGNEIIIKADKTTNPPTTTIFTGLIENIDFEGEGPDERLTLSGRDYTARLQDYTVEPEVYTNTEISAIVNDIFDKYTTGLTRTNVNATGITLPRITFNQVNVYEAFKRLAELSGFMFYVDVNKDLNFKAKSQVSSGLTLNNTNISNARFKQTREGLANRIWVYGDRYLTAAPPQVFTPSGGSVFTLAKKPFNTHVSYQGAVKVGAVFQFLANDPGSSQYAVSFHDKQIIFLSGTLAGNNVPGSNIGSVVINYDAEFPIANFGTDDASINAYGPLTKVIIDKNIKDPRQAQDRLIQELEDSNVPPTRGEIYIKGLIAITPGNTAIVNLPNFNINSQTFDVISARWEFTPSNNFSEKVLTITVNKKMQEVTDKIAKISDDLQAIKSGDVAPEDQITRFIFSAGSELIVGSYWEIQTQYNGSEFRWWPSNNVPPLGSNFTPILGLWNSGAGLGAGSISYFASGTLGTGFTKIASGGNF